MADVLDRCIRRSPASGRYTRLCGERLEPRLPLAFVPSLLADINAAPAGIALGVSEFAEMGGHAYFFGTAAGEAQALWKTDGTSAGTSRVASVSGSDLLAQGDRLFFAGGKGIWTSDGTAAGTVLIKDLRPDESDSALVSSLTGVGDFVFFSAWGTGSGRELWKTDGTTEGTVLVREIAPGLAESWPQLLTNVNGTLYFTANDGVHGRELWKSDGTEVGTVLVKDIRPSSGGSIFLSNGQFPTINGTLFFVAFDGNTGQELWKSDGTEGGTVLVKDIYTGSNSSSISNLTPVGATLYFSAEDGRNGFELWKSDGSEAGTVRVTDLPPGHVGPISVLPDGRLLFSASFHATELDQIWVSDGTPQNTKRIGPDVRDPYRFTALGSVVYFGSFGDSFDSTGLWQTDGTDAGTKLVKTVGYSQTSTIFPLTVVAGKLHFAVSDGINGSQVWTSDGTSLGTQRLTLGGGTTLSAISAGSPGIETFVAIGPVGYFVAKSEDFGQELWRTDGTPGGTQLVHDIRPGPLTSNPAELTKFNNLLYFTAIDERSIARLWTSDGTAAGTKQIVLDGINWPIENLTVVNDKLFFTAGFDLWMTDGTVAGTALLKKFAENFNFMGAPELTNVSGILFFRAVGQGFDLELWKSDGTPEGTVLVKDIQPGPIGSTPRRFVNVAGTLYFSADDGVHGAELWKSDGTEAGTVLMKDTLAGAQGGSPWDLTAVGSKLFFRAHNPTAWQLWVSDGTVEETSPLANFEFTNPPTTFREVNGTLFFTAANSSTDQELWKSDGTEQGTVLVRDINPGDHGSYPYFLTEAAGALLFNALSNQGYGLWISDGTTSGTKRLVDYPADPLASSEPLFVLGDSLVFAGTSQAYGRELWFVRLINTAPSFEIGQTISATDNQGLVSESAWATAILAGPLDEATQALEFVVETSDPNLFASPPALGASGRLTFTPKRNASGSATVTARLRDDSGTHFGGSDTSLPQTFTIEVTKPFPKNNTGASLDVRPDGRVLPADALDVINYVNAFGIGKLPSSTPPGPPYFDVVPDNRITGADALAVINHINAFGFTQVTAEGEAAAPHSAPSHLSSELLSLLAGDIADQAAIAPRRRRL